MRENRSGLFTLLLGVAPRPPPRFKEIHITWHPIIVYNVKVILSELQVSWLK